MRILMVSDDYLPNAGGIATHVHELSRELVESGHEVDLIVGHNNIYPHVPPDTLPPGMRVLLCRGFSWSWPGYIQTAWQTFHAIKRAQQSTRYDLCHWHSLIWESFAVRWGANELPRVFTNHSSGFLRRSQIPWRRKFQLPTILNCADAIITPSRELMEETVSLGYPSKKVHYISNGVDTAQFCPRTPNPELLQKYDIEPDSFVVIAPRRLVYKNGIDILVRACAKVAPAIPTLRVLLVGDGSERPDLQRLTEQTGVSNHIKFCGNQSRADVLEHLRLAQVAVLPSRAEAVSIAGLEAMAVGLPVIGSNVGGIPEFVQPNHTGWLFASESVDELARTLLQAAALSRTDLQTIGYRARAFVSKNFSWRSVATQTLAVYTQTLSAPSYTNTTGTIAREAGGQ
ncbi:MAG: glycosyltransferase family 4 protein [Myxococcales bacterium]|nr:glycosyltransferase family 4 protein [Myxococcales bacterium]